MKAVLLAGGKGRRLQPFTATVPKPLVPLDDVPVIEVLVTQLASFGIRELTVVTGHMAELVRGFLDDGERFGVHIEYFKEITPLDTAGCLGVLPRPTEPFLVMNGDLLTTLNVRSLHRFHMERRPLATVATYQKRVAVELGVVEADETGRLTEYHEKPAYHFLVSMGIYCFEPEVCNFVLPGERISMPDLILRLRDAGEKVLCYREDCYWLDIGCPADYARAVDEFRRDRTRFLPVRRAA
jgi:NDP-sugar pyrophosphorylase family protein